MIDYLYITLAIVGIGRLLDNSRVKRVFAIVSPVVLAVFGTVMIKGIAGTGVSDEAISHPADPLASFAAVLALTISNPMTIVFFASLFSARAIEHGYAKGGLFVFGLGTGMATPLFMGTSVLLFSFIGNSIPPVVTQGLNLIVGFLLVGYGVLRIARTLRSGTIVSPWVD
jgi:threonine/homoserine/homoserine lactone efflux protein